VEVKVRVGVEIGMAVAVAVAVMEVGCIDEQLAHAMSRMSIM
jgi:hypothetical protein